jgi:hypothetical protein
MRRILMALLIAACSPVIAGEAIGAWEVFVDATDMQIARTMNSDNAAAGVICFKSNNSCLAYFTTDNNCDEKAKYPIMFNAATGAAGTNATCVTISGTKLMVLDDFETTVNAFEAGGEIGFALPLQSGKFSISRFNCTGATAAIRKARAIQKSSAPTKNPASQVL